MHIVLSDHISRPQFVHIRRQVQLAFPNARISHVYVDGMYPHVKINDADADWTAGEYLLATMISASALHPLMPDLKLLQTASAGLDGLTEPRYMLDRVPSWRLCRNGNPECFGRGMSQYCIGWILHKYKNFDLALTSQRKKEWMHKCSNVRNAADATVAILGCGQIGKAMAIDLKAALHCKKIIGINRSIPVNVSGQSGVDEFRKIDEFDQILPEINILISLLPSTDATKNLLDNDRLANCSPENQVIFINIGRGDVITEESILKAVRSKWIDTAILDVFQIEPLPASSPLWSEPNVIVTPHVSYAIGSDRQTKLIMELFLDNIRRFQNGQNLLYEVNLKLLYENSK